MDRHSPDLDTLGGQVPEDGTTNRGDPAKFGELLRQPRESRQLTLQQVAEDTKIPSRHLSALEEGNVGALPHGMYRRAMLRAYADSVGLNRDTALEEFERTFDPDGATAVRVPTTTPAAPPPPVPARAPQRGLKLLGLVVVATVVVALIRDDSGQPAATPSTPSAERAAGTAAPATVQAPASPTAGNAPQPAVPSELRVAAVPPVTSQPQAADSVVEPEAPASGRNTVAPPQASSADDGTVRLKPDPTAATAARPAPPAATVARRAPLATPTAAATRPAPAAAPAATAATPGDAAATAPRRASSGELVITSEPAGARVTINGTGWGLTPVTVRHLPFGAKSVRVTKDGYASEERAIVLDPTRASARLSVTLSADGR